MGFIIRITKQFDNIDVRVKLFESLVLPKLLEYGSIVLSGHLNMISGLIILKGYKESSITGSY